MLNWDATYEIVLALQDAYPDVELEDIGTAQLHQMIVMLPDFDDDPVLSNEKILVDILREWYEESTT